MQAVLRKWGNSAAIRLPSMVLKESNFCLNQTVLISAEREKITITPAKRLRYELKTLLAGITKDNRHDDVDFGLQVGKESL
jgi:antitoxin MazE